MIIRETKSMTQTERMESRNSNFLYQDRDLKEHISQNKATPHIIESGKSGIWSYRKWSNGTAECWGSTWSPTIYAITNQIENLYYTDEMSVNLPSVLFVATPTANCNISDPWCLVNAVRADTDKVYFKICRGGSYTNSAGTFSVLLQWHVIGRWTEELSPDDYDDIPTVDQTYSPTSENAQSGTAVAEAVEDKQDRFAGSPSSAPDFNAVFLLDDKNGVKRTAISFYDSVGNNLRFNGVADPEALYQGANKKYVDNNIVAETKRANNTFANALKGSVSGETVTMNDVSPVSHEMAVKVRGKNLVDDTKRLFTTGNIFFGFTASSGIIPITLPKSTYTFSVVTADSTTTNLYIKNSNNTEILFVAYNTNKLTFTLSETQDILISVYKLDYTSSDDIVTAQLELGTAATPYTPYISDITEVKLKKQGKNLIPYPFTYETFQHNGITFTDNKDGTITLNGQNNGSGISNYNLFQSANNLSFLKPNTDYYLSCNLDNIIKSLRTVKLDGTYKYYSYGKINFSSDETPDRLFIQIKTTDTTTYDNTIVKLQIELGDTATDYEPYITPTEYTPDTDGIVEGVTSLYPTTTLTIDTAGAIIDCEYNRDTNKAYSDLLQRIAALETVAVNNV